MSIQSKGFIVLTIAAVALSAGTALAQPQFHYLTEFEANHPLAIAADANGGIYYTIFVGTANASKVFYVADPIENNSIENHIPIIDDDSSPANRGWTGVTVDDTGAVYAVNETGDANTCEVRKLTPAPEFAEEDNFNVIFPGKRMNGLCWMGRDNSGTGYLALTTFTSIEIWDTFDGSFLRSASGGDSYQRDAAYNPTTGDLYIVTNRNRAGAGNPQYSVNILRGGSVSNIDGYSETIENGFVPEGARGGDFGTNAQLIGFDKKSGLIMVGFQDQLVPDKFLKLAFYDPANPAEAVLYLDASDSPNGNFLSPTDAVTVQSGNDTLLFVTDQSGDRILVFTTAEVPQSVDDAWLY